MIFIIFIKNILDKKVVILFPVFSLYHLRKIRDCHRYTLVLLMLK